MAGVMSGGDTIDAAWKAVRRPRPFESFGLIHASPGVGAGYLAGIQNSLAGLTTHRSPITVYAGPRRPSPSSLIAHTLSTYTQAATPLPL